MNVGQATFLPDWMRGRDKGGNTSAPTIAWPVRTWLPPLPALAGCCYCWRGAGYMNLWLIDGRSTHDLLGVHFPTIYVLQIFICTQCITLLYSSTTSITNTQKHILQCVCWGHGSKSHIWLGWRQVSLPTYRVLLYSLPSHSAVCQQTNELVSAVNGLVITTNVPVKELARRLERTGGNAFEMKRNSC
jgi:hypothetical protein